MRKDLIPDKFKRQQNTKTYYKLWHLLFEFGANGQAMSYPHSRHINSLISCINRSAMLFAVVSKLLSE
jgi:hypothetical protein